MASVMNSFDLLKGAEAQLASKKKKNKPKSKDAAAGGGDGGAENGGASSSSAAGGKAAAVDVYEAIAAVERAAREAKALPDKLKLWKDWIHQVRSFCLGHGRRCGRGGGGTSREIVRIVALLGVRCAGTRTRPASTQRAGL